MTSNEKIFFNSFNALNESLEKAIVFFFNALYCIEKDYVNNKEFKEYIAFYDNFCLSNQYAMISCLNKLIDKAGFSLYELIEFVKKNPCMFGKVKDDTLNTVKEIQKGIAEHEVIIKVLIKHRNEFHSHLDKTLVKSQDMYNIFYENKISIKQIEDLLKFLAKSIVSIWSVFQDTYSSAYVQRFLDDNKEAIYEMSDVKRVFNKLITK